MELNRWSDIKIRIMACEKTQQKGILGMKLYNRWYGRLIKWFVAILALIDELICIITFCFIITDFSYNFTTWLYKRKKW